MIKNIYNTKSQLVIAHNGKGRVHLSRVLDHDVEGTQLLFLDYLVIPPGASIGSHKHQELEEVYIMISGRGKMTINNNSLRLNPGDVIPISIGAYHELRNDRKTEIHLIVCAVSTH